MEIAAASERTPTSATTNHNSTDATTLSSARVKSGTFDSGSGSTAATSSSTASLGLDKMSHPLQSQAESQDDTRTECETPVSSPEREMIVTRKMKQDQDQVQTRRMVTRSSSSESSGSNHRTGEPQSSKGQGPDGDADQDADNEADTDSDTDQDAAKEQKDVDFSDWPMENVKDPGENDVLYGRGGGTNHHEGNKRYRKMVERRKVDYVNSKRLDKPLVALDIIRQWREQKPPGRFLKFDEKTDTWSDVGDKKAREKTSQALREKAPLLRKQQEEQRKEALGVVMEDSITSIPESGPSSSFRKGGSGSSSIRQTRFDVPLSQTPKPSKKLGRARLARDHSLGVDFAGADEPISIQGFSWDNSDADPPIPNPPDNEIALGQGWERDRPHDRSHNNTHAPPHRSNHYYGEYYNHSSHQPPPLPGSGPPPSISNVGREQSLGGNPLPLATTAEPAPSGSFEEDQAQYPSTPMNSHTNQWSDGYHPHPPPHPHSDEKVQEAWAKRRYGDNDQGDYRQTRSADHHNYRRSHANMEYNTNQWRSGNDRNPAYDSQYGSSGAASGASGGNEYMNRWEGYRNGYYYPPEGRERHRDGHRDRMYNHGNRNQGQAHQQQWGSNPNSYGPAQENYSAYPDHGAAPQAHPYPQHHDGSFGGPRPPSSSRHEPSQSSSRRRGAVDYESTHDSESSNSPSRSIPRPQPIKRDTSHQNENTETKSQIKRMNRQRSIGSSRRQNSMSSLVEVSEMDMRNLGRHLRQSSIGVNDDVTDNSMHPHPLQKPAGVSMHERKLTIDQFDLGEHIEGKASPLDEINNNKTGRPNAIDYSNRGNSVESIKLDEVLGIMNGKPSGLGDYDRMGTFGSLSPTNPGDSDAAKIAI